MLADATRYALSSSRRRRGSILVHPGPAPASAAGVLGSAGRPAAFSARTLAGRAAQFGSEAEAEAEAEADAAEMRHVVLVTWSQARDARARDARGASVVRGSVPCLSLSLPPSRPPLLVGMR